MTRRFVVTFEVEYETDYQPAGDDALDLALSALMDKAPLSVLVGREDNERLMEPVGWRVVHPEWGDMVVGSLQQRQATDAR